MTVLNGIWAAMLLIACALGLAQGTGASITDAMLAAAGDAVTLCIGLAGGFAFFCGLIAILRQSGVVDVLKRMLSPALFALFGKDMPADALESVTLNLSANMLGLGNAATPMGLEAMRRMADGTARAGNAMCLFLVINASSVQLLPSTVLALRAQAGSSAPGAIVLPTLIATGVSTLVGVLACKLLQRFS